jgi:hypothetical protein
MHYSLRVVAQAAGLSTSRFFSTLPCNISVWCYVVQRPPTAFPETDVDMSSSDVSVCMRACVRPRSVIASSASVSVDTHDRFTVADCLVSPELKITRI